MAQNLTVTSEPVLVSIPVNISESVHSYQAIHIIFISFSASTDLVVEIMNSSSAIAGTSLTLNCTVTLIQPLRVAPVIVWVGPDGTEIGNGTNTDVTVCTPSPNTRILAFSPLHTDYGGEYRCRVSVDIAEAGISITNNSAFTIDVLS